MKRKHYVALICAMLVATLVGCGEQIEVVNPNSSVEVGGEVSTEPVIVEGADSLEDIIPGGSESEIIVDSPFQYVEETDEIIKEWEAYKPLFNGTHCLECVTIDGTLYIESEAEDCVYGEDGVCEICGFNPETDMIRTAYEYLGNSRHHCVIYQNNSVVYESDEDCAYDVEGFCVFCHETADSEVTETVEE